MVCYNILLAVSNDGVLLDWKVISDVVAEGGGAVALASLNLLTARRVSELGDSYGDLKTKWIIGRKDFFGNVPTTF